MSVKIRLTRMGRRNRPFYRVVVADSRSRRDGRFIEQIGTYDPIKENNNFIVKEDRVFHWLKVGAQPSETVKRMLSKEGIMLKWHLENSNITEDQKKIELQKWEIAKANREKVKGDKKESTSDKAIADEEEEVEEASVEKASVEEAPKEAPAKAPVEEKFTSASSSAKASDDKEAKADEPKEVKAVKEEAPEEKVSLEETPKEVPAKTLVEEKPTSAKADVSKEEAPASDKAIEEKPAE